MAVVSWFRHNSHTPLCTTVHIISFDFKTRLVRFRTAVKLPQSAYRVQARLGDWAGHGRSYLQICNTIATHGVPGTVQPILALFDGDVTSIAERYEIVLASPGSVLLSCVCVCVCVHVCGDETHLLKHKLDRQESYRE